MASSNEFNKISGAVLGVATFFVFVHIATGMIFAPKKPKVPGYELPGLEVAAATTAPTAVAEEPIAVRLAAADASRGERAIAACKACHAFEKGGANKVGPALWDVYDRAKAAVPGFGYSTASKGKANETWSAAALDAFLKNPKAYLPGTTMAYGGMPRPDQRADVVAYINSLSDAKKPLPKP
ncbi:MAG: c-type cytochrome [Bosea sp. (in: a-proteobacteria)]